MTDSTLAAYNTCKYTDTGLRHTIKKYCAYTNTFIRSKPQSCNQAVVCHTIYSIYRRVFYIHIYYMFSMNKRTGYSLCSSHSHPSWCDRWAVAMEPRNTMVNARANKRTWNKPYDHLIFIFDWHGLTANSGFNFFMAMMIIMMKRARLRHIHKHTQFNNPKWVLIAI